MNDKYDVVELADMSMTLALIVFLSKWCPYTHQGYDLGW